DKIFLLIHATLSLYHIYYYLSITNLILLFYFFFLIIRFPPFSPLFPYTTLFRSLPRGRHLDDLAVHRGAGERHHQRSRLRQEPRSEEHTSELQSPCNLVCRLLLEKKKKYI